MTTYILVNFEGVLEDYERDAIESALDVTIGAIRNILPYSSENETVENYVFAVVKNLMDPENGWNKPAFIIRLPEARPVFSVLFIIALQNATGEAAAILELHYTDDFPPEIDRNETNAIPLQRIHKKAHQLRYSLAA